MSDETEVRPEITLVDVVAWAVAGGAPRFHLTGCTAEERIMIATAERVLATFEMQALNGATFMAMTEPTFARSRQWCDSFLPSNVREWVLNEKNAEVLK